MASFTASEGRHPQPMLSREPRSRLSINITLLDPLSVCNGKRCVYAISDQPFSRHFGQARHMSPGYFKADLTIDFLDEN